MNIMALLISIFSKISKERPSESWMSRKSKSGCGFVLNHCMASSTEWSILMTVRPSCSTFRWSNRAAGFSSSMMMMFMIVGFMGFKSRTFLLFFGDYWF